MNTSLTPAHLEVSTLPLWPDSSRLLAQCCQRQHHLTYFALAMAALAACFFLAGLIDERLWRGAPIWLKPMKFAASTFAFAITTAWWIGLLPASVRKGRAVKRWVGLLILTASFEVVYITFQASLGQGSHHNRTTPFHAMMFGFMGFAAVALTATQAALAVLIVRHHRELSAKGEPLEAGVLAVVLGLWMTFILGTISGMALGSVQPPSGSGLPMLGWHLNLQDYRPAHFMGIHAHQLIPLMALAVTSSSARRSRTWVVLLSAMYAALWYSLH